MPRLLIAITFLLSIIPVLANSSTISLTIPEATLAETVTQIVPLELDTNSDTVTGKIHITNISDIELNDGQLACNISLSGKELKVITKIGSTKFALNIGETQVTLATKAAIRYDKTSRSLFITPSFDNVSSSSENQLGAAILPLIDGKELQISIDQIKPFVAETISKDITLNMVLEDIIINSDEIEAIFTPNVSSQVK